jgi:hypothetical protein
MCIKVAPDIYKDGSLLEVHIFLSDTEVFWSFGLLTASGIHKSEFKVILVFRCDE